MTVMAGFKNVFLRLTLSLLFIVWFASAKFKVDGNIQWIKCNVNQTGFYRVTYDDDMWHRLVSALENNHTVCCMNYLF